MIAKDELLKGRDELYPNDYTPDISTNLDRLLVQINVVRTAWNKPMNVNSGWRPPSINAGTPGAAKNSAHCLGLAVDISDTTNDLWNWVLQNLQLMKDLGFFFEDRRWTTTWVHFGLVAPKSGLRIFIPNANRPTDSRIWNGQYDHSFDITL